MEPLDPELRRIIREGLAEAAPGPAVEGRVLAGLLAKLPPDGGGDGGGDGGDAGPGEILMNGVSGGASGASAAGGVKAWWVAGVVALGVVTATAATRETEPKERAAAVVVASRDVSKDRSAVVAAPVVESAAVERREVEVAVEGRGVVAAGSTGRRAVVAGSGAEGRGVVVAEAEGDELLAESRGIAEAEAALGRGEFALALARVGELARSHPAGQLRLEREAVEICARCGLREAGAGAGAEEFLRAHAGAAVAGKVRARCAEALEKKF